MRRYNPGEIIDGDIEILGIEDGKYVFKIKNGEESRVDIQAFDNIFRGSKVTRKKIKKSHYPPWW